MSEAICGAACEVDPDVASAFALRATADKSLIRVTLAIFPTYVQCRNGMRSPRGIR